MDLPGRDRQQRDVILILTFPVVSSWWWIAGIVVAGLLLLMIGRLGARASVAGQLPPDAGPDLKASEKDQEPDIRPEDQNKP